MGANLIAFVGVVYLIVAGSLYLKGQIGLGIAFFGYAVSNIGLYLEAAK